MSTLSRPPPRLAPMPAPILPFEVVRQILRHLLPPATVRPSSDTHLVYSHISAIFTAVAQSELFSCPCLTSPKEMDLLLRSIEQRPHLAAQVRELRIVEDPHRQLQGELEGFKLATVARKCPNLRRMVVWNREEPQRLEYLASAARKRSGP